ncbi:endonuclease III [Spirochaetia bacterium]|nr:endonuclease III [Spirochaetia bacterium]GHU33471.1 endonuclease III [Spirochaetia bacterium]
MNIEWDSIFSALESWYAIQNGEPAVTMVASTTGRDPWAILLSTIVSLRTKDAVTMVASRKLLAEAPDPMKMDELPEERAAALVYPAGFYRTKAKNLKKIARILLDRYNGQVPADMNALLALPGVGRKTANLVLIEAFDMDGICVDTHVHRISNRTGWVCTPEPDKTESALRHILPIQYWKRINTLLVLYGQNVCTPRWAKCEICTIAQYCNTGIKVLSLQ